MAESFTKGENFEKYVLNSLFLEHNFVLIHRTNNYEDNQDRFSENTLKPDFKFRCLKTQKEFYVEAKYRSKLDPRYASEIINKSQYQRFISIEEQEGIPVYFVIGFYGKSSQPNSLSLFPLKEILDKKLSSFFIEENYRGLTPIINLELNLEPDAVAESKLEPDSVENPLNNKKGTKKKFNFKKIIAIIAIISFCLFGFNYYENFNTEKTLKEQTKNYYQIVELGEIEDLKNYIAPVVNNWYGESNLTRKEVIRMSKHYNSRFPTTKISILWDTFNFKEINDEYITIYELDYKIITDRKIKFKNYHLKIRATWTKDLNLVNIEEERLNVF